MSESQPESRAASSSQPVTVTLDYRRMEEEHLAAVAMLDRLCQPHSWTPGHFRDELARGEDGHARILLDPREGVVGYLCAWKAADELHIGTIGIDPQIRRKGLARGLLLEAHRWAKNRGCTLAVLEVRAGNSAAIALYEALGYRRVGVRRGYYQDNGEDAALLLADL